MRTSGNKKRAITFRTQIILTFVTGFLVLVSGFTAYMTLSTKSYLYENSRKSTAGMAQSMAVSSRHWVLSNDVEGLKEIVNANGSHPDLQYAMIISSSGRILAHSSEKNTGQYLSDKLSLNLFEAQNEIQYLREDSSIVDIAYPILLQDKQLGWARIARTRDSENKLILQTVRRNITFVVLASLLSLLAAWLISKQLGSNIKALIKVAEDVQEGNVEARAKVPSTVNEMIILGDSLNGMLDALEQAQEEIIDSEQRYHFLFNNNPMPMWVFEESSLKFLEVNQKAIEHYGYSQMEFNQMTIRDIRPPIYNEYLNKSMKGTPEGIFNSETIHQKKDGSLIHVIINTMPMIYDGVKSRIVLITDITEMKKADQALYAEKERLAVTLRSIGDGVITTDTSGKIVMLNQTAERLTGWKLKEAIGKSLSDVYRRQNMQTHEVCPDPVTEVLNKGKILKSSEIIILKSADGKETIISESAAPIHNNVNMLIGIVLVIRDMTEKQKLEESLQKSHKLESLGILAGGIAHDFNNLLSGIFGYIELAASITTQDEVLDFLKESISSMERARSLTQQLLTFAKGGTPVKKVESLFPFIKETIHFALSGSSLKSEFKIADDLWPCEIDKNQIAQVMDNLTINAMQSMPNGGTIRVEAINIHIPAEGHDYLKKGNYVKLSIRDEGTGIPEDFLSRIFDPYYSTKPKGQGLGLSTCYSIIHRHGGCIDVESSINEGSCFHIYIPSSTKKVRQAETEAIHDLKGKGTILVMDDEAPIRKILKEALNNFGFDVILTENGEEAIEYIRTRKNNKLKAMIFDLTIPGGMGGKEAINIIREIEPQTPVFVSSGYSEDTIIAEPEKYGFTDSIAKPFMIAELSKILEKHLIHS